MNLCGKILCIASIATLCVILERGVYEESIFSLETNCGKRKERTEWFPSLFRRKRFIGGSAVNISTWPWVVSVQHLDENFQFIQRCAGVIIKKDWILTATECFHSPEHRNLSHWRVVSGSTYLFNDDGQISSIKNISLHTNYHAETTHNNIALLKLEKPLVFNERVDCICIPDLMNVEQFKYGACHIVGHDHTNDHGLLKESAVQFFPRTTCNMPTWRKFKVTADMFCAGFQQGGVDGCHANLGGPLSCYVPAMARYYVRGIRVMTGKCGVIRRPNIYLQVSKYFHWIESQLEDH